MEHHRTKIKFFIVVVFAWLIAVVLLYLTIVKIKLLFH
jgi:hypothetical protein